MVYMSLFGLSIKLILQSISTRQNRTLEENNFYTLSPCLQEEIWKREFSCDANFITSGFILLKNYYVDIKYHPRIKISQLYPQLNNPLVSIIAHEVWPKCKSLLNISKIQSKWILSKRPLMTSIKIFLQKVSTNEKYDILAPPCTKLTWINSHMTLTTG